MPSGSSPTKVNEWTNRLERFAKSQKTVARFCQLEGVSMPSFYQWRKKLRELPPPESPSQFQPVCIAAPLPAAQKRDTIIRLGNGIRIRLGSDLPVVEFVLKQLLEAAAVDVNSAGSESC